MRRDFANSVSTSSAASCNIDRCTSALTHTSARVLEFESLRDLLRGYASSPLGQETDRMRSLPPSIAHWIENPAPAHHRDPRVSPGGRPLRVLGTARYLEPRSRRPAFGRGSRNHRDSRRGAGRWTAPPSGGEIALSPPAAMKVRLDRGRGALIRHHRLHRIPARLSQQDPARRHARRPRLAGTGPHPPRDRKTEAANPGIAARLSAASGRRRRGAG